MNRYTLEKYFLQAIATVTGDTVVDPEGELSPGEVHRVPFSVSDADLSLDLIVVSEDAPRLSIAIEGPTGQTLSLSQLRDTGRCRVTTTPRIGHVDLNVPFDSGNGVWGPGTWTLSIGNARNQSPVAGVAHGFGKSASYLAMVTTRSALRFHPALRRTDRELILEAALDYGGAPILRNPSLFVELTTPWGVTSTLPLAPAGAGLFRAALQTTRPGRYRAAFRVRGTSLRGHPFQRERVVEEFFTERAPRRARDACCCSTRRHRVISALSSLDDKLYELLKKMGCHRRR